MKKKEAINLKDLSNKLIQKLEADTNAKLWQPILDKYQFMSLFNTFDCFANLFKMFSNTR